MGASKEFVYISIGILAWNEEDSIAWTLESLLQQSIFQRVKDAGKTIEFMVVANGCTDRTAEFAQAVIDTNASQGRLPSNGDFQVVSLQERGKANAWNIFVHSLSSKEAEFLFLMDADIVFNEGDTMWAMLTSLNDNEFAEVATDTPTKDIRHASKYSFSRLISLATSRMTQAGSGQLTGQLYCIRSSMARRIRLPYGVLGEDGFIKTLVCTDLLTVAGEPQRIVRAPGASHEFKAYTKMKDILNNQKRQQINQAITYFLCDVFLPQLSEKERCEFADTVRQREVEDREWCIRPLNEHVASMTGFWNLYPNALTFRWHRLTLLPGHRRVAYVPVAMIGSLVDIISCYRAYRALSSQEWDFWPDTGGRGWKGRDGMLESSSTKRIE